MCKFHHFWILRSLNLGFPCFPYGFSSIFHLRLSVCFMANHDGQGSVKPNMVDVKNLIISSYHHTIISYHILITSLTHWTKHGRDHHISSHDRNSRVFFSTRPRHGDLKWDRSHLSAEIVDIVLPKNPLFRMFESLQPLLSMVKLPQKN